MELLYNSCSGENRTFLILSRGIGCAAARPDRRGPSRKGRVGLSIKVAVIDDQDIIRLGVQQSLSQFPQIDVVGEFSNLESFLENAVRYKIDVVLLDDLLPGVDLSQALHHLQQHCPETSVLLLGSRLTALDIHRAIQAGASGVICKTEPVQDVLVMGIRHAHAGKVYLSPQAALIALRLGSVLLLNAHLHDVLRLIADGYRVPEIAYKLGISRKAVYERRTRLRELLDVETNEQIVAEALRRGWLSPDP